MFISIAEIYADILNIEVHEGAAEVEFAPDTRTVDIDLTGDVHNAAQIHAKQGLQVLQIEIITVDIHVTDRIIEIDPTVELDAVVAADDTEVLCEELAVDKGHLALCIVQGDGLSVRYEAELFDIGGVGLPLHLNRGCQVELFDAQGVMQLLESEVGAGYPQ